MSVIIDLKTRRQVALSSPLSGEELTHEVCALIERRLPLVAADDSVAQPLRVMLPELQTALGRRVGAAVETGRRRATEAMVKGYENAIDALDPSDAQELAWFQERLQDARAIAGLEGGA